ncbi:MAG: hypothetical protein K2Q18_10880 [Bdellovibrionales bacterium]|nr:hypothetical protein [Bdellovibrionales bacterium]
MGISFTQILLGSISFGLGYYLKARFEINQGETIKKLQLQVEKIKNDDEKKEQRLRYQLWEVEQVRDRFERDFLELREKVKNGRFNSIPKIEVEINSRGNVLKSFL